LQFGIKQPSFDSPSPSPTLPAVPLQFSGGLLPTWCASLEMIQFFPLNQPIPEKPSPKGVVEINRPSDWQRAALHCECGCSEIDLAEVVGWCLHCDHVYATYNPEIENRHFAYHCPGAPLQSPEPLYNNDEIAGTILPLPKMYGPGQNADFASVSAETWVP